MRNIRVDIGEHDLMRIVFGPGYPSPTLETALYLGLESRIEDALADLWEIKVQISTKTLNNGKYTSSPK